MLNKQRQKPADYLISLSAAFKGLAAVCIKNYQEVAALSKMLEKAKQPEPAGRVTLEYCCNGDYIYMGSYPSEGVAWFSVGPNDDNYRTLDASGNVLTDKSGRKESSLKTGNKIMPKKANKLIFVVNCNPENINIDNFHEFTKIGLMRSFINENHSYPMEISVWDGEDNLITLPSSVYWRNNRHPTLNELINPK